jgi:hypothetical protein
MQDRDYRAGVQQKEPAMQSLMIGNFYSHNDAARERASRHLYTRQLSNAVDTRERIFEIANQLLAANND